MNIPEDKWCKKGKEWEAILEKWDKAIGEKEGEDVCRDRDVFREEQK